MQLDDNTIELLRKLIGIPEGSWTCGGCGCTVKGDAHNCDGLVDKAIAGEAEARLKRLKGQNDTLERQNKALKKAFNDVHADCETISENLCMSESSREALTEEVRVLKVDIALLEADLEDSEPSPPLNRCKSW